MSQATTERRLFDVASRLEHARSQLAVVDEQLAALVELAEDARVRSLLSETPLAHRDHTEAQRHADAMSRTRRSLHHSVVELQAAQDELLDKLVVGA